MKLSILFALVLGLLMSCAHKESSRDNLTEITTKPAQSEFHVRPYETQKLPNGMTIMWFKDEVLPYVSMQLLIKTGSAGDMVGKEGLASFAAAMLEKGTLKRKAPQISEDLEQIGANFSTEVTTDYTILSMSGLSFYQDQTLDQYQELLFSPSFDSKEMDRHRKQLIASMQKMADEPQSFTNFLFPKFLFGKHPYGHPASGNFKSIKNFRREDLQAFYRSQYVPSQAVLAVVGQFDASYKEKVVRAFSAWNTPSTATAEIPDFPNWRGMEMLLVDRGDLKQAQIEIGFKGVPRNIPEFLELRAALKILGESFGSRLMEEIRVKRGLTYSISAWFDPRLRPGPMGIYTFTRTDKIGETVEETLKTYRQFVKAGVTDQEVETVKNLMRGQFPRTFETPEALARQLLLLNRYGIGEEYLTQYLHHVEHMNKEQVNATIAKYFDPENLRILVYAPRAMAEPSLLKLGKVEIRSYKEFLQ